MNTVSKPQTDGVFESLRPAAGQGRSPQAAPTSDRVDIGNRHDLVSQAQNATAADRAAHIEQLRALVQSGGYQVDAEALSRTIISAALGGF